MTRQIKKTRTVRISAPQRDPFLSIPDVPVRRFLAITLVCGLLAAPTHAQDDPAKKITFDEHIQPIFRQHCLSCHSADTKKSDLAIDAYATAMEGGASGEVVIPGDPEASRLWALVTHQDEPTMPPATDKLPDETLDLIRRWIEGGALENSGSVAKVKKNSGLAMLKEVAIGKPDGPAAMPESLFREPIVYSNRASAVAAVAASPWAPLIAVAGQRQVALYHSDSANMLGILPFPEGVPQVLVFSRDGSRLLVAGGRGAAVGRAVLYNVETGSRLVTVGDEFDAVLAADVNAQQTLIALGSPQKVVRVFDTADGALAFEIRKHTDWITAIAFSPDGQTLLTADRNGGAWLWEAETGREIAELRGHSGEITSASWRADSQIVATAGADGTVRLWGDEDGKQVKSWAAHGGGAMAVNFAADGRLVTAGRDRAVKLWNGDGKHLKDLASFGDIALAACFSHDGKRIAAGDFSGEVRLIDVESGQQVGLLPPNPPTLAMRLTSASAHLETVTNALGSATKAVQAADKAMVAAQAEAINRSAVLKVATTKLGSAQTVFDAARKEVEARTQAADSAGAGVKRTTAALATAAATVAAAELELSAAREAKAETAPAEAKLTAATEQAKQAIVGIEAAQVTLKMSLDAKRAAEADQATASAGVATAQQSVQTPQAAVEEFSQQLAAVRADVAAKQQARVAQEQVVAAAHQAIQGIQSEQAVFAAASDTLAATITASEQKIAEEAERLAAAVVVKEQAAGELATRKAAADEAAKQLATAQAAFDTVKQAMDEAQSVEHQKAEAVHAAELAQIRAETAFDQAKADKELFEKSQAMRAKYVEPAIQRSTDG
jgi:WD40 repeat protein